MTFEEQEKNHSHMEEEVTIHASKSPWFAHHTDSLVSYDTPLCLAPYTYMNTWGQVF